MNAPAAAGSGNTCCGSSTAKPCAVPRTKPPKPPDDRTGASLHAVGSSGGSNSIDTGPLPVEALEHLTDEKNVALFTAFGVLSPVELTARREILLENYAKVLNIEAQTMIVMASRQIIPAVETYIGKLAATAASKAAVCADASMTVERDLITRLSALNGKAYEAVAALRRADAEARAAGDELAVARAFRDKVVPAMEALRAPVDEMETMVASEDWPLPTYGEMTYKQ